MKVNKNQETCDRLDSFWDKLTDEAKQRIVSTDFQIMHELFGHIKTPEDMNEFAKELNDEEVL